MLKNLFYKFKNFIHILKQINKIHEKKPKFIFYSENKNYLKYGYLIIEYLSKKYPGEVYYISSDINDSVSDLNVINIFIGKGFLLQYFFKSVATDNLFMTVTDLSNNIIKKNKYVKNHIYFFMELSALQEFILQKRLIIMTRYYVMVSIKLKK